MNIILLSQKHGTSRHISNGRAILVSIAIGLVALPLIGLAGGYFLAQHFNLGGMNTFSQSIYEDVQVQRDILEKTKQQSEDELKAITRRIAEMQARLTRLDALGERLIDVAKLRNDEFDFSQAPAVGGPGELDLGEAYEKPKFMSAVDQLLFDIERREEQLAVMESLLENRKLRSDVFIAGRPIKRGWMSSRFGRRTDPFTGRLAWHKGVDFAGKEGADIITVASGVVTWAEERYGYGLMVEVNHGGGFSTRYAHCKEILVKVGDVVRKGQLLAEMGSTGRSTGPHVHFEVWKNGSAVDPTRYIHRASR